MTTYNKTAVKQYILNAIDFDGYDNALPMSTDAEKLQSLDQVFRAEYGWMINRVGYQAAMREWISGLPSCFEIEYRNHAIIELAIEWGSLTINSTEREQEKIIDNFFNFVAAKTTQMIYKVN